MKKKVIRNSEESEKNNIVNPVDIKKSNFKEILKAFFFHYITERVPNVEIIILITKKSYFSFKTLADELDIKDENPLNQVQLFSDRYFLKLLDFSEFNNKNIVIVDDTMNTGVALRSFYHLMKEQCPDSTITPIVCLLNDQYDGQSFIEDENDKLFQDDLDKYYAVSPEQIGKMCVLETALFHENLVPYVVDLPIFEWKRKNQTDAKWVQKLTLKTEQFEEICKGNSLWSYHDYSYSLIPGMNSYSGFFSFYNSYIQEKFESILLNMIVKVQYEKIEDDSVDLVFTPFVILNSVRAEELQQYFYSFFNKTKYGRKIKYPSDKSLLSNYYTAIYRSMVYMLSMYTGVMFLNYMKKRMQTVYGDEWPYECRIWNKQQFDNDFYESIDATFPRNNEYAGFDENKFLLKIANLEKFSKVSSIYNNSFNNVNTKFVDYSKQDWFAFLYEKIIETKRSSDSVTNKYLTSEEFEDALISKFENKSTVDTKSEMTKLLLQALNKSILSNHLYYDDKSRIIYRGYRYGENTELLLPYDARIFYKGIKVYFERIGEEQYYSNLESFCTKFKDFLIQNGVYNYLITDRHYLFFTRYFSSIPQQELLAQIENKNYLLDDEFCRANALLENTLNLIEEFVNDLDFGEK